MVELKLGELNNTHLEQLEDYLNERDQILTMPSVKNTVYGENQKWIGVLVGRSIRPDLAEKIKGGYVTESGIPIAALTIARFRSAQGTVYVVTDTYFNNKKSNKDTTQYQFNEKTNIHLGIGQGEDDDSSARQLKANVYGQVWYQVTDSRSIRFEFDHADYGNDGEVLATLVSMRQSF